jgi:hypothetical protein
MTNLDVKVFTLLNQDERVSSISSKEKRAENQGHFLSSGAYASQHMKS